MATKNIFAILDSDDEDNTPKVQTTSAPAAKEQKPKTVKPSATKKDDRKKDDKRKNDSRPRTEGGNQRGGRNGPAGGRGGPRPEGSTAHGLRPERERGERPDRSHHTHHGENRHERSGDRTGDRTGDRSGKRSFERRSGTGRGKETSKHGGGARNWGNEADQTELVAEAEAQEGGAEATATAEDESAETSAAAEETPVEEEDNEMTLDEYLAKKKESRTGDIFADKEVREVANEFSNSSLITKDGKTPDFIEASYEKVFTKKTSGRKKNVLTDVGFSSAPAAERRDNRGRGDDNRGRGDDNRGRGDDHRGGRGDDNRGGRGGRGHGRSGGRRGGANAPNVTDHKAFPSLK